MRERRFGEAIPIREEKRTEGRTDEEEGDDAQVLEWMRSNECGQTQDIRTAFGTRRVVYADYAASARAVKPIEEWILREVHPLYGNTHSSVTTTSEQTTLFVHEARQEVRSFVGAGDGDAVIFTGSGSTAAVNLLTHLLQLKEDGRKYVVLHSIMEHHSNLLPWTEAALESFCIHDNSMGRIDKEEVRRTLRHISGRDDLKGAQVIGAFSAASNVTGVLNDYEGITGVLKEFGALSVWDFAAAAPYVRVEVNGETPLDAAFFSPHKMIGAVGTPGVLVVKKSIIRATRPLRAGGGTVFFVDESGPTYLRDVEYREEGGTPDAVGVVRLALALKLRKSVNESVVMEREEKIVNAFLSLFHSSPSLVLLGPPTRHRRLATFSFLVKDLPSGLFFHANYISALLNDLFGIQSRSGCACVGPYAQKLLGISGELTSRFLSLLLEDASLDRVHLRRVGEYSVEEMLRPSFSRISLHPSVHPQQLSLILQALHFISQNAAHFLHEYQVNAESGEWHHEKMRSFVHRKWISDAVFDGEGLKMRTSEKMESCPVDVLEQAKKEAERARMAMHAKKNVSDGRAALSAESSSLRWFILPIEVWEREVMKMEVNYPHCVVQPFTYDEDSGEKEEERDADEEREEGLEGDEERRIAGDTVEESLCPLNHLLEMNVQSTSAEGEEEEEDGVEEEEESEGRDDWSRRIIVRSRQLDKREEAALPWVVPPLDLYKQMTDALHGLKMIQDGDRVLVCLSGGKDSLSLLHMLRYYQTRNAQRRGVQFQLGAITVDPGSSAYNPRPLIEYCRKLNIDYFYEEQDIMGEAKKLSSLRSICAFCSRMKRGRLAAAAKLHGWNVLAMGQHLDDLAESFFIAAFQNGNLSTMKAQYTSKDGSIRVIRPLVFVRETSLRAFAVSSNLPVVPENCPACFSQATERHRVKQMLASQELLFPQLFCSLRSALRPLLLVDSAHTADMRRLAIENIVKGTRGREKSDVAL